MPGWEGWATLEGLDLKRQPMEASSLPVLGGIRQLRELRLYHTDLTDIIVICKLLHHPSCSDWPETAWNLQGNSEPDQTEGNPPEA